MTPASVLVALGCVPLAAVGVPLLFLLLQVVSACRGRAEDSPDDEAAPAAPGAQPGMGRAVRTAVLVPAHDEAGAIEAHVRALRAQMAPADRLLVVADNCHDDTAARARDGGAEVIERRDEQRRGKGYALDAGVRHLQATGAPEVIVFVDADCRLQPGALDRLAQRAMETGRPVQALYLMEPPPGAGVRHRLAAFAWRFANLVRARGQARLGGPCLLTGSGMALPWPLLSRVSLATGHLVEDKKLGVELHRAGASPVFEAAAVVRSEFPLQADASRQQRSRWQQGQFDLLREFVAPLLKTAIRHGDRRSALLAMDLLVPPLSLLFMLMVAVVLPIGLVAAFFAGYAPAATLAAGSAALWLVFAVVILLAWHRFGRAVISGRELLRAPLYALRALPIYLDVLRGRRAGWVRTRRSNEP